MPLPNRTVPYHLRKHQRQLRFLGSTAKTAWVVYRTGTVRSLRTYWSRGQETLEGGGVVGVGEVGEVQSGHHPHLVVVPGKGLAAQATPHQGPA